MRKPIVVGLLIVAGLAMTGSAALAQNKPAAPANTASEQPVAAFHVTLLLADNKPGTVVEGLTAGAAKALKDAKEFLPFKNFKVLDSVLVRTTARADTRAHVEGPEGRGFSASIRTLEPAGPPRGSGSQPAPTTMSVYFGLIEPIWVSGSEQKNQVILSSNFNMEVGETVVVGTSKVRGAEQALVVLLTAVPASALK